jgi:hypothetical protein
MVIWFLSLIFIKVKVKEHHSSFKKTTNCTVANLINLMYLRIFYSKICDEEKVFHNLVRKLRSNVKYVVQQTQKPNDLFLC